MFIEVVCKAANAGNSFDKLPTLNIVSLSIALVPIPERTDGVKW
jgi:hypothetical protein